MKRSPPKPTIPPYKELTEKKLKSLGAKLEKVRDPQGYKHHKLIEYDSGLLWHLFRHGLVLQEVRSAGMLRILSENTRGIPAADILAVIRRLPPTTDALDKGEVAGWASLTPHAATFVDDLLTAAYVDDPAAVRAIREELSPTYQLAIDFVRRRGGEAIDPASSAALLRHLVDQHAGHGLDGNWDVPRIVDGKRVESRLMSTEDVQRLAELFGSPSAWAEEALAWMRARIEKFRGSASSIGRKALAGLRLASLAEVIYLYGNGWWDPGPLLEVLDARADSPDALFAAAQQLAAEGLAPFKITAEQFKEEEAPRPASDDEDSDDDDDDDDGDGDDDYDEYGGYERDDEDEDSDEEPVEQPEPGGDDERLRLLALVLTIVGIERAQAIPPELDARFDLDRVFESDPQMVTRLRGAVARLGPARAHAIVRNTLAKEFYYGKAAALLDIHFDPALVSEAFARFNAGEYHVDPGLLGFCAPVLVPQIAEAQAKADKPDRVEGWGEAILYILGRASAAGQDWDPAHDKHVQLDFIRFNYGGSKVDPVLAMLDKLPLARWTAIVTANLTRCAAEPWRLARVLRADVPPALLDRVLAATMAKRETIINGALGERLQKFGPEIVGPLLRAIGDAPAENSFVKELDRALSDEVFALVKAGLGKAIETPEQELRRLAASVEGEKVAIYRLRRGEDEPDGEAVARIGGTPRGVIEVPEYRGEPMEHVLTLDLAQMPALAKAHPEFRSVSLYLPDPDNADDHSCGQLVWTREEELSRAPGSTENAVQLEVEAFEVPTSIFDDRPPDGAAGRVRGIVYTLAGYAGGYPLWVQESEDLGIDFLFQFDESLCHINLGDMGVMYVFEDSIDWQCH
ncbi:hypothetical protein [Nannocystis punicea]|uniref:DUF4132 domain-containing protein n=1 Tax=Nannocystis punicea TaxID=2995304 RepID=A0ABY7HE88_9BACT|nr:hypothetical protein [Nannocystis poenicansa]WAS97284.1 hypothetical protein O0S08_14140 [Nannocystis poenicansa]